MSAGSCLAERHATSTARPWTADARIDGACEWSGASRRLLAALHGHRAVSEHGERASEARKRTRWRALGVEAAFAAAAFCAYSAVRLLVRDDGDEAFSNAVHLMKWESGWLISWERHLQAAAAQSLPLIRGLNAIYALAYWLTLFAAFPLAPPRFADPEITDTIAALDSHLVDLAHPRAVTNKYAAMPSFHSGWTLACAACVGASLRRKGLRLVAALLPLVMGLAVIATGNHYIADVVVGGLLSMATLWVVFVVNGRRTRVSVAA